MPANMKTNDRGADRLIMEIGRRAGRELGMKPINVAMDLTAVHCNGCPLRLQELLDADEDNFSHDIAGIRAHLDRETGKLRDHFVPRYADTKEVATKEGRIVNANMYLIELAQLFKSRSDAVRHSGEQRDRAAVEYFCGAASFAAVWGDDEAAKNIGTFIVLLSTHGYAGVEQLLAMSAQIEEKLRAEVERAEASQSDTELA